MPYRNTQLQTAMSVSHSILLIGPFELFTVYVIQKYEKSGAQRLKKMRQATDWSSNTGFMRNPSAFFIIYNISALLTRSRWPLTRVVNHEG